MRESSKVAALLLPDRGWASQEHPIWLCSTQSLFRNVQQFRFPNRVDNETRRQILDIVGKEVASAPSLQGPQLFKMEECSGRDKELIFEHFLSIHPYTHPQAGEGFVLDKSGEFLAVLNQEDHLEYTLLTRGEDIERSFKTLLSIESAVGQNLHYAFSPTFGFLTSNPSLSGTALVLRVFLHIPAILQCKLLEQLAEKHKTEFVQLGGLTGSSDDFVGNVVVVSNTYTLGVDEETIFAEVRGFVTQLLVEERGLRAKLQREERPGIKDHVSRAFGLIKYSYQVDTFEALNALSLLKLGLELYWIEGTTNGQLNALFFGCRRAHLSVTSDEDLTQEQLGHHRALFLREQLDKLQLKL